MKRTLGGDRLGSGKKNEVELHNYGRSTHDLGYLWRSTMSAGTLVPFLNLPVLPGDTFDINLGCDVKTHPTVGPLFGSFKVQLDVFLAPIRLYQGALHNNKLGIGLEMNKIKLPIVELESAPQDGTPVTGNYDNTQINPSCIFSYLGIRGVGFNNGGLPVKRAFSALGWLVYMDTYKNYYANKQEEIGAIIHTPRVAIVNNVGSVEIDGNILPQNAATTPGTLTFGTMIEISLTAAQPLNQVRIMTSVGPITVSELGDIVSYSGINPIIAYNNVRWGNRIAQYWYYPDARGLPFGPIQVQTFPLSDLDEMRDAILRATGTLTAFKVNDSAGAPDTALLPFQYVLDGNETTGWARQQSQEGLALKTYQSDLFNNWLQTEWIDGPNGINELTKIDTSSGSFKIDALLIGRKVYDMMNRIAVSGGSYDDWLDAVWTHDRYTRCETPMYMGGLSKELVFQEVVSNSESAPENEGSQPLGTLAGKGVLASKHKGGSLVVKVDEPSILMGIVSLTPRIDYSQGNEWHVHLKTMDDLHKPGMDEIGFQELIVEQMAWWSTYYKSSDNEWIQTSAGKQPAWLNYMTAVNKVYGNFAIEDNEMFMTLNRKYQHSQDGSKLLIDDLTTYIDPAKYNTLFAQTSLDSQNFWTQISVDITARRKMSARIMPNL